MDLPLCHATSSIRLGDGMVLLPGRAGQAVVTATLAVIAAAPPRRMTTPWGKPMSVAMTNCGRLGWISDAAGYRYSPTDPLSGRAWPPMPPSIAALAESAAEAAGFPGFAPEACLVNLYEPAARMGLHQDRDEEALDQPIVSISLGRTGRFRFGGPKRRTPIRTILLSHGDVLVFGGPARLIYHGLDRLEGPPHPPIGDCRINLTLRRVTPMG